MRPRARPPAGIEQFNDGSAGQGLKRDRDGQALPGISRSRTQSTSGRSRAEQIMKVFVGNGMGRSLRTFQPAASSICIEHDDGLPIRFRRRQSL